jgi:hypothetical protein
MWNTRNKKAFGMAAWLAQAGTYLSAEFREAFSMLKGPLHGLDEALLDGGVPAHVLPPHLRQL